MYMCVYVYIYTYICICVYICLKDGVANAKDNQKNETKSTSSAGGTNVL